MRNNIWLILIIQEVVTGRSGLNIVAGDFSILCQLSCTLLSSALEGQMFDGEMSSYLFLKSQNFENSQVVLEFFLHLVRLYSSYGRRNNDHLLSNGQLVVYNSIDTLVSFREIFLISWTIDKVIVWLIQYDSYSMIHTV